MRRAAFWKRATLAALGVGSAGGLAVTLAACGSSSGIQLVYAANATYTYDGVSRSYLADRAYSVRQADLGVIRPDYSLESVGARARAILTAAGEDGSPNDADGADFVYRLVRLLVENNPDGIVAWRDPSRTSLPLSEERYVVYLEGGPLGDVCHQYVDGANSLPYSREFYVNEGQYGLVPRIAALAKGTTAASNAYFLNLKTSGAAQASELRYRFGAGLMSNYDYLRLIGGNATYDDDTTALLSSLAVSIVTTDRTATLLEKLSRETSHVFVIGESYGMHAGLELLTQRPEALQFVERAELGRNVLVKGGGHAVEPKDDDGDGRDDSTVSYGDSMMIQGASRVGLQYGYIDRLNRAIANAPANNATTYLQQLRDKVTFGFSSDDATIGPLPSEDRNFYAANGLNLKILTGGHSAFNREQWGQFVGSARSYDYSGLSTVIAGRPGGCTVSG